MGWFGRRPTVVPLLILAAVLVAIGAGPDPDDRSWTGVPDLGVLHDVFTVVVLGMAAIGLGLLLFLRKTPGERPPPKRRSWAPSLLALALVFLLSFLDFEGEITELEEQEEPPVAAERVEGEEIAPGPGFEAEDGAALLIVLGAALAALWWASRRDQDETIDADDAVQGVSDLDAALERAERHLLDRDDPRGAVLLAYRDLESTLEALGLERRSSETPTEHLTRALADLGVDDPTQAGPVIELASLYARARFSDHPITGDERARAADALGRARRRLAAPS